MTDYTKIVETNISQLRIQMTNEMGGPEFPWKQLIDSIIHEDSPLQEVYSERVVHLADLCRISMQLEESARHLKDMDKDTVPEQQQ